MATKSDIVSGMGLAMSIVTNLVSKVKKAGGTDEDIHRLATPDGEAILEKVADMIVSSKRPSRSFSNARWRSYFGESC